MAYWLRLSVSAPTPIGLWGEPPAITLGVWSRDEVVRVGFERSRVLCPGLVDGLEGGSPSEPLQVLGEVVGRQKGQDMGLQAFQVRIVEHLDGGVLHGAVHPLGLAVRPGVI